VKDFDGCNAEKLERAVLKQCPEFKIVSEHAIELFGTCKKCAESA
jgi:Fe2+ or Zn2+ uptake regulation protein